MHPDAHDPKAELLRISQIDAEKEALELRLAHWSYPDIADIQGVSVPTVRDRIERAIQHRIPDETRNQMRKMEGDRLDRLQKMNQLIIDSSSTSIAEKQKAQEAFLAVQARRARLFGLDMPVKLDVKYSDSLDQEIESLMGQLAPGSVEAEAQAQPEAGVPWDRAPQAPDS